VELRSWSSAVPFADWQFMRHGAAIPQSFAIHCAEKGPLPGG
jgi:hypothetical protein